MKDFSSQNTNFWGTANPNQAIVSRPVFNRYHQTNQEYIIMVVYYQNLERRVGCSLPWSESISNKEGRTCETFQSYRLIYDDFSFLIKFKRKKVEYFNPSKIEYFFRILEEAYWNLTFFDYDKIVETTSCLREAPLGKRCCSNEIPP